ncbi:glycosyltransferase [Larkinella terrae]|uniref:Glycosyltransferase n=1 Tax=Larkinella terrae TaxID=2025311 RepID=A0A7K0EGN6_9BACT|nr:glycosyltransferase [Larkinella terrae]MRS60731.1 glycosyltransferase [Larkinella terrae]
MRLLHVISELDPKIGGTSQAVRTIIEGLSQLDVINEVVSLDDPNAPFLGDITFVIHATGPGKTPWKIAPKFIPWLAENLHTYDVVIVHGLWHYHTYAIYKVWSYLKVNKPALYLMPHGMLDPWFQRAAGRKLKAIRNWLFWKFTEQNIINRGDGLLFTCETEKIVSRESFSPYAPKAEKVVGLGVESPPNFAVRMEEEFRRKCNGLTGEFLLFLGRINIKKGVDLLIKAYLDLKTKGVQLPRLVIAGPGLDSPFGQSVLKLASIDKDIVFPGMLSGDAKWGAFYKCDAFILPSHQENFGIAVVEALACSKPVLISDQVNIWREINTEKAGIVENDTESGVNKMLKQWMNMSAEQKKQMGLNANTAFHTHFTISRASGKMINAISQAIPTSN